MNIIKLFNKIAKLNILIYSSVEPREIHIIWYYFLLSIFYFAFNTALNGCVFLRSKNSIYKRGNIYDII